MNDFSTFKSGVVISSLGTLLPFLGLLKQLSAPTGDASVILILGTIVSVFFCLNIYLVYIAFSFERFLKASKICRVIGYLFFLYPFVGFAASLLILKATAK